MTDAPKPPKVNPSPFLPQPKPVEPKPVEPIEHTEQFEQVQPQVQKPVQPKPVEPTKPVQVEAPKPQPKVEQTPLVQPIPKEQEIQSTPVQKSTKVTNAISVLESIDKTGTDEQGIKAIAKELASMSHEELKQIADYFGIEPVNDTRSGTYFALDQWLDKLNQPKLVEQEKSTTRSTNDVAKPKIKELLSYVEQLLASVKDEVQGEDPEDPPPWTDEYLNVLVSVSNDLKIAVDQGNLDQALTAAKVLYDYLDLSQSDEGHEEFTSIFSQLKKMQEVQGKPAVAYVRTLPEHEDRKGAYWTLHNYAESPWNTGRNADLRNAFQSYAKTPSRLIEVDPNEIITTGVLRDLEMAEDDVEYLGPLYKNKTGDHIDPRDEIKLIEGSDGKLYAPSLDRSILRALAYGQDKVTAKVIKESDVPKGKEELRYEQEQEELKTKFKPLERLDNDVELSKLADYIAGAEERYEKEHNVLSKALLDAWEQKEEANKVFKEMDRANVDNEAFYESPEYIEADAKRVELRIKHLEIQDQFDSIRQRMNEEVHKALTVPQEQQTTFDGTPTDTADTWTKKAMGEANKFIQSVLSNDALKTRGEQVKYKVDQIKPTDEQRASYTQASQMVNASVGMPIKTMVHEIGHHLEHIIPGAFDLAKLFLDKRVGTKNKPVRLEDKLPGHGYKPYEYSMGDDDFGKLFNNPALAFYIAKIYSNATEVISMGLEMLYENPIKLAHTDPDLFKFIVGILRGKHK